MSKNIFNKNFRLIFLLILLAELLSFLGYYYQIINWLAFFGLVILTLILTLRRLEYGLYILLTELFIGSFGYLFYFESGGLKISIRLALWLIIMSVWLAKAILSSLKTKRLNSNFLKSDYFNYFLILFIFMAWGLINGLLNNNYLSNIFFDFNNWLYFLLIFPIWQIFNEKNNLKILIQIFLAGTAWLSLKTIMLAYFFSHNFSFFTIDLYRWIRLSGVGEITQVQGGFYRIFMQSQIFVLIGFFIILFKFVIPGLLARQSFSDGGTQDPESLASKKILDSGSMAGMTKYILLSTLFLSAIIISFSRSFWLGLAAGGALVWLIAVFKLKIKLKQFIIFNLLILSSLTLSLILILAVLKFPFPSSFGGFNTADLLSDRATKVAGEAGASSRWQLLEPLWQKIKAAPILGQGLGATVIYKSNDPRLLSENSSGQYTAYAFEWGWLDVWLKLGIFGLLSYLILCAKIIFDGLKTNSFLALSLTAGLIILLIVNIFSPYVNHPLGIGYVILAASITDYLKNNRQNIPLSQNSNVI